MNKYRNKICIVEGITFHSKREGARYQDLLFMARAKHITKLLLQPKFPIEYQGVKICTVIGDFEYFENDKWVVEDVKGMDTPVSKLKRKMIKAFYPSVDWRVIK